MMPDFLGELNKIHAEMIDELLAIEPVTFPVSGQVISSLLMYRDHHVPVGSFLEAVLSNDLKGAVGAADIKNQYALCAITSWCYNNMPRPAWGSPERYQAWLNLRRPDVEGDPDAEAGAVPGSGSDGI
jgi:hypothetical protein